MYMQFTSINKKFVNHAGMSISAWYMLFSFWNHPYVLYQLSIHRLGHSIVGLTVYMVRLKAETNRPKKKASYAPAPHAASADRIWYDST